MDMKELRELVGFKNYSSKQERERAFEDTVIELDRLIKNLTISKAQIWPPLDINRAIHKLTDIYWQAEENNG